MAAIEGRFGEPMFNQPTGSKPLGQDEEGQNPTRPLALPTSRILDQHPREPFLQTLSPYIP